MSEQSNALRFVGSVPIEHRRRGRRHAVAWGFHGVFQATVFGLSTFVIRKLGGSALQSQAAQVALAVPLLFSVLWGPLLERHNPARTTGLLMMAGGMVVLFTALTGPMWPFVGVWFLGVLLSAFSRPLVGTALERVYPRQWRGKLMSLPNTVGMLSQVLWFVWAGWLLRRHIGAYRFVFPLAGLSLICSGAVFRRLEGSDGHPPRADGNHAVSPLGQFRNAIRSTFMNHKLTIFLSGYFVTTWGAVITFNLLPLFAADEMQLDPQQWGYAQAGFYLAALTSFYLWGVFMDRFGAPATIVLSWTLQLGLFLAYFFVRPQWAFIAVVVARGFFQAGNILAFLPIVMHFTDPSQTSRGMSLHYFLWGVRWLGASIVVAWIKSEVGMALIGDVRRVFLFSAALVFLGLIVMSWVWYADRDSERREQINSD